MQKLPGLVDLKALLFFSFRCLLSGALRFSAGLQTGTGCN
jgi:hypothetical protein